MSARRSNGPPRSLADLARASGIEAFLSCARPIVEAELRRRVRGIREGFLRPLVRYQVESGGKRLRPALALLSGVGLGADLRAVLSFAASCELLHNFFLVHDDIEDGDRVRRDRPALWARVGLAQGLNAGDYLFALAVEAAASVPAPDRARAALVREVLLVARRTILGQALDIRHRGSGALTAALWRRIVGLKTGDYLALTLVGPARIAGAPRRRVEALRGIGRDLGVAFQARDDVLDLTPGKGRGDGGGGDIREGKPSILAALALARLAGPERRRLVSILRCPREETRDRDVAWARAAFARTGAVGDATRLARRLAASALARLERLGVRRFDLFEGIVRMIVERER